MPGSSAISFRVPPATAEKLDALSEATDRPKTWHLEQALEAYLETQSWQISHMKKGLAELAAGKTVAHGDVAAWLKSWGSNDEGESPA